MSMRINNTVVPYPSMLREEVIPIQTDQYSANGRISRKKLAQKWQATATWEDISPDQYRAIRDLIITGSGIYYYNDLSAENANNILAFSGMPFMEQGDYVKGASLNKTIRARFREI